MTLSNDRIIRIFDKATPNASSEGPPEYTLPEINIKVIAPPGAEATLLLHPTGPNTLPPTMADIEDKLQAQGIIHGINWPLIEELCGRPVYYHVFIIARQTPPQKGPNGYVEYFFNTEESLAPVENDDGTLDYKNTDYIKAAGKGQVLCRRHPAMQGLEGVDIFGTPIPGLFGEPPMNPAGKNTVLSEDQTELLAGVSGHIRHSFGIVAIEEVLTLAGVDNSTGNIDFIGDVVVTGNIAPGFKVKATGNITIKGSVEGAILEAGAKVIVSEGIIGMGKSSVSAGCDIKCKFIQNSQVNALGSVYADSVMLSNIDCGGDLILSGMKATLVGGKVNAQGKVVAKKIGSRSNSSTEINIKPPPEAAAEIEALEKKVSGLGLEMAATLKKISRVKSQTAASANMQQQMQSHTDRYNNCAREKAEAEIFLAKAQALWEKELQEKYYVECKGEIYSNTIIKIHDKKIVLTDDYKRCRINVKDNKINMSSM